MRRAAIRFALGAAAAGIIAFNAHALPLEDWGDTTYDPNTGLEWLDLTLTEGWSINQFLSGAGGYRDAGFQVATVQQVLDLFASVGITNFQGVRLASQYEGAVTLGNLLGITVASPDGQMQAGQGFAFVSSEGFSGFSDPYFTWDVSGDPDTGFACRCRLGSTNYNLALDNVGLWLVRTAVLPDDPADTPEAGLLGVFGLSLLGLGLVRRRKSAK